MKHSIMIDTTNPTMRRYEDVIVSNGPHSSGGSKGHVYNDGCNVNVNKHDTSHVDRTAEKQSNENTSKEIPDEFICPITQEIMKHPLMSRYGQTFERDAIMTFLTKYKQVCPITRQKLHITDLIRHRALEYRIGIWIKCNHYHHSLSSNLTEGADVGFNIEDNDDYYDDDQSIVLTCTKSSLYSKKKQDNRPIKMSETKLQRNVNKGFIRSLIFRTKRQSVSKTVA